MTNYPTKKLGEVIEINYGKGLPKDSHVDSGKYFAYGSNGPVYRTNESLTNSEIIVIGRKGTAGALYFISEPCWPIDTTFFAKPKNGASLKFIYYLLQTKRLPRLAIVTGVPGINRTTLANINIQLPPLEIQKQIVERLDKIVEAQKLNDDLIQKSDELFQSLLHKELNPTGKDWGTKKLGEVIEISYGKGLSRDSRVDSGKYFAYGSNGPVYRTNESLTNGEIIVIGRKGTAGALYFISDPCWPIDTTFFAKPKNDVSLKFVYYLLQTKGLPRLAIVTGVPGINRTTLANVNVQLPPINTQKQIAAKLSTVQDYKTQLLAQKSKLKELFNSVLSKSFSGQ